MDESREEHIVPKMHIYQFTENGLFDEHHRPLSNVTILRRGANKPFKTKDLRKICSITNFYDLDNPINDDRMEDILADAEIFFNGKIDNLRKGTPDVNQDLAVFYVSLMLSRSIEERTKIRANSDGLSPDSIKIEHAKSIGKSTVALNNYELDDYGAIIILSGEEKYITSDNPVIQFNNYDLITAVNKPNIDFSKMTDYNKEIVYLCPISPSTCIAVYHKENRYSEMWLRDGRYYNSTFINKLMSLNAVECLFYSRDISDECVRLFNDNAKSKQPLLNTIDIERAIGKDRKKSATENNNKLGNKDN